MVEPSLFPKEVSTEEHVRKQSADAELIGKVSKNVNSVAATLRILEERYSNLRNRGQVSEQTLIELEKDVRKDIKLLSDDMVDLKREMNDIRDKLRLISAEIKNLVDKNDFRIMERYVDMWQPMNFVTRNELSKLLIEKGEKDRNKDK